MAMMKPVRAGATRGSLAHSATVHLIEAQALFVPTLTEVFAELGLEVRGVSSDLDMQTVLEEQPDVLFVDVDYVNLAPLRLIDVLRMLVPNAVIGIYTSERSPEFARQCHQSGASAVFSKNAGRNEILAGMRDALSHKTHTDVRLRGETKGL